MTVLRSRPLDLGVLLAIFLMGLSSQGQAADPPRFEPREIDPHVGDVCYAVTLADVDGDGKSDIVAVSENRVVIVAGGRATHNVKLYLHRGPR
jgi:hypothetical protein